ncbi:MAG TPA: TMEM175 family protein [Candidatus Paceibacterota bacterium]
MKPSRLEQLSDGIFAIVMTVLVFEIKAPVLSDPVSAAELSIAIREMIPFFLSYLLSFALLFTYWRAHHFFVSVYAKNIDRNLTNINALFFLFLALIPFSTSLLGKYNENQFAIIIFGVHTMLIGFCLFGIRRYVFKSEHIKNIEVSAHEIHRGTIRLFVPVLFAFLAIILSFVNKNLSLGLFTAAVIFNFSHTNMTLINKFFKVKEPGT